jgi:putative ABC transport system permease protein
MKPYTAVLLKTTADIIWFRRSDRETISIDNVHNTTNHTVTGVVDESLGKSHLHANIFVTMNGR